MRGSRSINTILNKYGKTMHRTGLVFDPRCLYHAIEQPSPENPDRLRALYRILQEPRYRERTIAVAAREAGVPLVEKVHSSFYLDQLRDHAVRGDPFAYDKDTYLMEESLPTALLAAGGCLQLADAIMAGDLEYGFALVRPPGHHACAGRGMGFCILNNVALTARHLLDYYGLSRILIVDFDVHHANGTQEIFYESNRVLVFSIHQRGIFPFSGAAEELGVDKGLGYSVNIPVHPQFGDHEYTYLLGTVLQNLAEQYLPQFILVSAGYDGHADDSISQILLSTEWFASATAMLRRTAREVCDNRLLFILEGGYNPLALERSVLVTLEALLDEGIVLPGILPVERALRVLHQHPLRNFWTV